MRKGSHDSTDSTQYPGFRKSSRKESISQVFASLPDVTTAAGLAEEKKPLKRRQGSSKYTGIKEVISHGQDHHELKNTLMKFEVSRWLQKRKAKQEKKQPPEEMKQLLRQCFDILDDDGTGTVEVEEIVRGFKILGFKVSREYVEAMIKNVDKDGSGSVDFDEFVEAMMGGQKEKAEDVEEWTSKKLYKNNTKKKENPYVSFDLMAVGLRRKAILECIFDGRHSDPMLKLPETSGIIDRDRHPFMRELFMPKSEASAANLLPHSLAAEDKDQKDETVLGEKTEEDAPAPRKSFLTNKLTMRRGILLAANMEQKKVRAHDNAMEILKEWPARGLAGGRRNSMEYLNDLSRQRTATSERMGADEDTMFIHELNHQPTLQPGNMWEMRGVWVDHNSKEVSQAPEPPPLPAYKRRPSIRVASIERLERRTDRFVRARRKWDKQLALDLDRVKNVVGGVETCREHETGRLIGTEPTVLTDRAASRRFDMRWGRLSIKPTLPSLLRQSGDLVKPSDLK